MSNDFLIVYTTASFLQEHILMAPTTCMHTYRIYQCRSVTSIREDAFFKKIYSFIAYNFEKELRSTQQSFFLNIHLYLCLNEMKRISLIITLHCTPWFFSG